MPLIQLTYLSQPFGFDDAMLAGILLDARRCNRRDGITGALLVRRDVYLQMLEGPQAAVTAAYDRIRRDDRHANIRKLGARRITERLFARWAMRDDPAQGWLWSMDDVQAGAADRADEADARRIFQRLRLSLPV
ncbi:MAG: BLUF domain-containing protein [Rhodobacteraceae bacterium]|nr:BLUF domain-containing protein [Paracoccaceae bacterium]